MLETSSVERKPEERAPASNLTPGELAIAAAIAVAGLILRIRLSMVTYLNPDEASHALYAFTGWRVMALYSYHVDKHPPLFMFLTHFVLHLSRNDLALRLIPILAGVSFPILFSIWLNRIAGKRAALVSLFLLTLSPHFVILSAQVRGYTLTFLFLSGALLALEAALDASSWRLVVLFDVLLFLGVCTDYSTAWFVGAAGIYAFLRLKTSPRAVKIAWGLGQIAPAIFYIALFFMNVIHLHASRTAENARIHWLSQGFPQAGTRWRFPIVNTAQEVGYTVGSLPLGIAACGMFAAGIFFLWTGRTLIPREKARPLALFLTVPFLMGIIGAFAGVFPYGPTRQSLIIGVLGVAGISVFVQWCPRLPIAWIAAAGGLAAVIWIWFPNQDKLDLSPSRNRKSQMVDCLNYMHANIPADAAVFTDRETLQMLMFYEGARTPPAPSGGSFIRIRLADRWEVGVRDYQYTSKAQFNASLDGFRARYGILKTEPVWVLDGGFAVAAGPPDEKLPFTRAIRVLRTP